MQVSTSSIKAEWTAHMEKTESQYIKDTSAVEIGKKDLEEDLENWYCTFAHDFCSFLFFWVIFLVRFKSYLQ